MIDLVHNDGMFALVHDVASLDEVIELVMQREGGLLTAIYKNGETKVLLAMSRRMAEFLVGCESVSIIRMSGFSVAKIFEVPVRVT